MPFLFYGNIMYNVFTFLFYSSSNEFRVNHSSNLLLYLLLIFVFANVYWLIHFDRP